jgi:hypothetical protein
VIDLQIAIPKFVVKIVMIVLLEKDALQKSQLTVVGHRV